MLWGVIIIGAVCAVINVIATVVLSRRARELKRAGANGEIAHLYRTYQFRAVARVVAGVVLMFAGTEASLWGLRFGLWAVGVVLVAVSVNDYRAGRRAERLADESLRRRKRMQQP